MEIMYAPYDGHIGDITDIIENTQKIIASQ
jgi:hypothetical protein